MSAEALGISLDCRVVRHNQTDPYTSPFDLWTNNLKLARGASYQDWDFVFHQYCRIGTAVWDPSVADEKDLNGTNYHAPPKAWPEAGYLQTGSTSPFLGSFQGFSPSTPSQAFFPNIVLDSLWVTVLH